MKYFDDVSKKLLKQIFAYRNKKMIPSRNALFPELPCGDFI